MYKLSILLFSLFALSGFAQEIILPDTFQFYKPDSIKYALTLDTINEKIFDSIENPKAYLVINKGYYSSYVKLAIKDKHGYKVFVVGHFAGHEITTVERTEFTGYGTQELVLTWLHYAGHSGWENSIHENWGGIQIWDLDSIRLLMEFENYYSAVSWWQEFEEDSTHSLSYDERTVVNSGGESTCSSYRVTIQPKTITIQEDANCPDQEDDNRHTVTDHKIYVYVLKPTGLILTN
jgi:hypothetical protein